MRTSMSVAGGRPFRAGVCVWVWLGLLVAAAAGAQSLPIPEEGPERSTPVLQEPARAGDSGTIRGLVTDAHGVPIVGARIVVQPAAAGAAALTAASDEDGRFTAAEVPTGEFQVSVSFPGFDTAVRNGTLRLERSADLAPFALRLSVINISVDALSTREVAAAELQVEETQRLLGFAPNFFVSYRWDAAPLTAGQKFGLAWKNVRDPGNLLLVGTVAGVQQATNAFSGYHQGAAGYGRRYGADLGNLVAGTFLGGAIYPSLFRQDPRYFYKGSGSFGSRVWYAMTRAVVCRGDDGRSEFNWSGVLGDLSAGAISNAYYPLSDRHGPRLTLENGFLGIAGDAMNGLVQEFFFKKITPKPRTANGKRH